MARIAMAFGIVGAAVAGAVALSYLANGIRQAEQGQQAKPG
jgi:hypothetical protein